MDDQIARARVRRQPIFRPRPPWTTAASGPTVRRNARPERSREIAEPICIKVGGAVEGVDLQCARYRIAA
jgi:hypothetical protein